MKYPFSASLLALLLCIPTAQARDNAIAPIGFGSATWLAHPHHAAKATALRISDSADAGTSRIGVPALMPADARHTDQGESLPGGRIGAVPARARERAVAIPRPLTLRLAHAGGADAPDALASLNAQTALLRTCGDAGAIDAAPEHLE